MRKHLQHLRTYFVEMNKVYNNFHVASTCPNIYAIQSIYVYGSELLKIVIRSSDVQYILPPLPYSLATVSVVK
jgi:hypothetical protein